MGWQVLMATPMTADQFLAALKAEGLHVVEHAGWRDHNRNGHGGWGPMNGVMIHHTAGSAPGDGSVVWSGRSDLPGPLAHGYLAKSGTVTMTANGRANHAGGGDAAVLAAVVAERVSLPATHHHEGSSGAVDGNAHFYGLEISNQGTKGDPYPAEQYRSAVRWAAAICRHHGWSERSVIGHKEWSDWKSDPSFDMNAFRAAVAMCLAVKPAAWGAPKAPAAPIETKEDTVALTKADAITVWGYKNRTAGDDHDMHAALVNAEKNSAAALVAVQELAAKLDALAAKLAD
jgi:hypothetical protein